MTKIQQQKNEKIKAMSKHFFTINLIFTFKVGSVGILAMSYYLIFSIGETQNKSGYLDYFTIVNDIEGIFKTNNDIFMILKYQTERYAEFETVLKPKALLEFENPEVTQVTIFGTTYTSKAEGEAARYVIVIPDSKEVSVPKVGSLLMPLISQKGQMYLDLNEGYSGDACKICFGEGEEYNHCKEFWSSILVKGLEQAMTQMGVVINSIGDEGSGINGPNGGSEFKGLFSEGSSFSSLDYFINFYMMVGYKKTLELFKEIQGQKLGDTKAILNIIFFVYVFSVGLLFGILLYFVQDTQKIFGSLLNFIAILPVQYLADDDAFYKDVLKGEQDLYN